jgi:hypothetical protein
MVQLFPGASEDPQRLTDVKALRSVPTPGVTETFEIDKVPVPMFFTVTFRDRRLYCLTKPKSMLPGVTLTLTCRLVTVRVTEVACVIEPSTPVTRSVYTPGAAVPALTVSAELPPAVTEVGLSDADAPLGIPETVRLTVCALPEVTAVEIELEPEAPCRMLTLLGLAAIEKSLGG